MPSDNSSRMQFIPGFGSLFRKARGLAAAVAVPLGIALGIGVAAGASGCQPARSATRGTPAAELVAEGRARGLEMADPLELDADMERDIENAIGRRDEPRDRLHKLVRYLNDRGLGFKQLQGVSLPARQAFHERRGNCMTYAMLFVALSRHIGLETYFVHASDVRAFYEKDNSLFASSHIAVGYGEDPGYIVVDFYREFNDWNLSQYRRIDDAAAVALYFNNLAVDQMNAGHPKDAQKLLSFLVEARPSLAELHNNLIVVDLRLKRYHDALDAVARGIGRFPAYKPLYTNGIQAANGVGDTELARAYYAKGQEIVTTDPLFVFARALQLYEREEYTLAAQQFERALEARQDSVVIVAWLVRAHLSAGHHEAGQVAFAKALKLAPGDARLKELETRFPELREVAQ